MVFAVPGHYGMLGVHVNEVTSFHAVFGVRGTPPAIVTDFVHAIEEITKLSCPDKTPKREPRPQVANICAGYACAFSQWFMANYTTINASHELTELTPQDVSAIHSRAVQIYTQVLNIDQREGRCEFNPNYNRRRTRSNNTSEVPHGDSRDDPIVF